MAQDEIILKLKVEDGQLKGATAAIDKQSKALDRNTTKKKQGTRASNRHNKAEKALYQTNLSSSKAFSKMNQTMGGSSGVVAAYATLAANVFALTAAFGALSRAAEFSTLEQGLVQLGAASGQTLSVMAEGLREITGGAISAEQAMRGAALGVSGGFGGAELKGLAEIAKGASITLGRDLADAFDRLTRGAIKLEPEILDELGIMVRLDDAVENYAAQIGKTAGSLTQMERRQAFMNAILIQGEEKFGAIARATDPNPYARLGATFGDLAKNIFNIINKFTGLEKVVGFLADNIYVLFGVMILFGSTIASKMLPFLADSARKATEAATAMKTLAANAALAQKNTQLSLAGNIAGSGVGSAGFQQTIQSYAVGTSLPGATKEASIKALTKGQTVLNQGITRYRTMLKGANAEKTIYFNKQIMQYEIEAAHLQGLIDLEMGKGQAAILSGQSKVLADSAEVAAEAIDYYQAGAQGLGPTLTILGGQYTDLSKKLFESSGDMKNAGIISKTYNKALASLTARFKILGQQARVLGAALLKALPMIGLVVALAATGYAIFQKFWNTDEVKAYNKQMEKLNKILKNQAEISRKYFESQEQITSSAGRQVARYQAISGAIKEQNKELKEAIRLRKLADKSKPGQTSLGMGKGRADREAGALTKISAQDLQAAYHSSLAGINIMDSLSPSTRQAEMFGERITEVLQGLDLGTQKSAISNIFQIQDSAEWLSFQAILKHEIPEIAVAAAEAMEKILLDPGLEPEERVKALETAYQGLENRLGGIGNAVTGLSDGLKEAEKEASKFLTSFAKSTKVTELAKQLRSMNKNIKSVREEAGKLGTDEFVEIGQALSGAGTQIAGLISPEFVKQQKTILRINQVIKDIEDDINMTTKDKAPRLEILNKLLTEQEGTLGRLVTDFFELLEIVNKLERIEITTANTVKQIASSQKLISKFKGSTVNFAKTESKLAAEKLRVEKQAAGLQIQLLERIWTQKTATAAIKNEKGETLLKEGASLDMNKFYNMSMEDRIKLTDDLGISMDLLWSLEQAGILQSTKSIEIWRQELSEGALQRQKAVEILKEEIALQEKSRVLTQENMDIQAKITNFKLGKGASLTPEQVIANSIKAAHDEYNLKQAQFTAELELLKIKRELQIVDLLILDKQMITMGLWSESWASTFSTAMDSIDKGFVSAVANLTGELANSKDNIAAIIGESFTAAISLAASGDSLGALNAAISAAKDPGADDTGAEVTARESVGVLQTTLAAGAASLKELGPGGEAYAQAAQGIGGLAGSFLMLAESTAGSTERMQGIMGMMTGIGSIMNGLSKARVAAIDSEIKAEEARDGKSAKSLAKIKALKKKKYEMEKKAFEQDKKIKMANALISTYAGVARGLDEEWPLNFIIAASTLAMGMMQVKAISATKFSGAAPKDSTAAPPSITIGKRNNKVDTSKAASAGELAYLRGERGIGTTSTNFMPQGGASGLRKGYGAGGEILVGERGPEVIRPTADGYTVVPNDAIGGKNINAHFEIHAIDAQGVEEVLVGQQGTIINMLRSAANDHGEEFLEVIDTTTYGGTPKSPGGIDY